MSCSQCGEPYNAKHALRTPAGLSCGHTMCLECAEAATLCVPPVCTVCKAAVAAHVTPNPALAAAPPHDAELLLCSTCPAEAQAYCCQDHQYACGPCSGSAHAGCQHVLPVQRAALEDVLLAKGSRFRRAAADAAEASNRWEAKKAALVDSADAAVAAVIEAASRAKARLDAATAARVAEIRGFCERALKQLEAEHDALSVSASQLGAAAAACAAACAGQGIGTQLRALASLTVFEALARQPPSNLHFSVAVRQCEEDRVYSNFLAATQVDCIGAEAWTCLKKWYIQQDGRFARGLAVAPDGKLFAATYFRCDNVGVNAVADGALMRVFNGGGPSNKSTKFCAPEKLAFHPFNGNILVADRFNKRVQEVSPTGVHVRVIGAGVIQAEVSALACNGDVVAVGKLQDWQKDGVMLFDYASGALLRSMGQWGNRVGQLGACLGLRFTPDGHHIVVASGIELGTSRLSLWSVGGEFVREVGRGALQLVGDVEIAPNGDWIASDAKTDELVVFSGVDGGELRRFGGAGKFNFPWCLARAAGGELWVTDDECVQVFRM